MIRILLVAALAAFAVPVLAADVGVSISLGEPGFYGRINIGDTPRPDVIYAAPVIAYPQPAPMFVEPMYLHVPPGYEKHWRKHCHEYDACGRPVYFVRDSWYQQTYVPYYREHEGYGDEHQDEYRDDEYEDEDWHHGEGHGGHHH